MLLLNSDANAEDPYVTGSEFNRHIICAFIKPTENNRSMHTLETNVQGAKNHEEMGEMKRKKFLFFANKMENKLQC